MCECASSALRCACFFGGLSILAFVVAFAAIDVDDYCDVYDDHIFQKCKLFSVFFSTCRVARLTLQTQKLRLVGWWMSRPTVPRVTFDLPECKDIIKNLRKTTFFFKNKIKKKENKSIKSTKKHQKMKARKMFFQTKCYKKSCSK